MAEATIAATDEQDAVDQLFQNMRELQDLTVERIQEYATGEPEEEMIHDDNVIAFPAKALH